MVYNISIAREAGGTYILSKSEERAAGFDANMDSISKITFNIGGYHNYIVEITGELKAYTKLWEDEEPLLLLDVNEDMFTKSTFLDALKELLMENSTDDIQPSISDTWCLMVYSGNLNLNITMAINNKN